MPNRWLAVEYLGKGVALALLVCLALAAPDARASGVFFGATAAGFVLLLGLAAYRHLRQGYQVRGKYLAFFLFLLLENPELVYAGLLGGMLAGTAILAALQRVDWWQPLAALGGGLLLGIGFSLLRQMPNRWLRGGAVLVLAAALAGTLLYWLENYTEFLEGDRRQLVGIQVLLAIPILYLLTVAGRAEETELEIGAMCVALGVGLWILLFETTRLLAILLPIAIYLVYTQRVLRGLQVFKHVLRGMSYNNVGRYRDALLAYGRALELSPRNEFAREGLWRVHRDMDFSTIADDPETLKLINLDLCLNRARELLLRAGPTTERLEEAHKLLNLVLDRRPEMQPAVYYWRAVAHTHARDFDNAEEELRAILEGANHAPDDRYRESVLVPCWELILLQHAELRRRVGEALLHEPGRRMAAIAAVERRLAASPDETGARELKKYLYDGLTEADYAQAPAGPGGQFDYEHVLQLGQMLIADPAQRQRGAEYLRIAAQGLPAQGPAILYQIAQACLAAGDQDAARYNLETAKLLAREIGIKKLGSEERKAYFSAVKYLGESAYARGETDKAIENLTLYSESEQSGIDTLRVLAELHEKRGDALAALHANEKALLYNSKDKLLLERKDRYYYSVTPADLQARLEQARKIFDLAYCLRKAKSLLDHRAADQETVDWASHLAELARVVEPQNIIALVLCARARLKRGDEDQSLPLLEKARADKPERFSGPEEEEAWYTACRLLADLYLQRQGRADLALPCLADYRRYSKSGADTLYKMGQAYEQLGDRGKAAKCYQNVTIYSDHPLVSDAYMALQRLEAEARS